MKKTVLILLSFILVCFCTFDIQVFASEESKKWDRQGEYGGKAEISIDTTQKCGNGEYSIKITNTDYGVSRVEKTFDVKPHTMYRASVMVKCVDFEKTTDSKYDFGKCGAVLTKAQQLPGGVSYTGSMWKKLTYCFDSGDEENYTLALYNAGGKGTAYFSDFKLEEVTKESKEWNLCVVYFKSIEAPIVQNGEERILSQKFCQEDIEYCTDTINQLYSFLNLISEGNMDIKSIDFYECDKTVKTLSTNGKGSYSINNRDETVSEELDKIIADAEINSGKRYDQIVIVSPLPTEVAGKLGAGDMLYNNIHVCQLYINHLEFRNTLLASFVHEILHSVEGVSMQIDPENTVQLHAYEDEYSQYYRAWQNGLQGNCTWFSDYTRRATHDGRGLNEMAFYTYGNSESIVVYGSTEKANYKTTDVGTLKVSKISDSEYTGKEIKPAVTVEDGIMTLKNGKDYTLSYSCNTDIGIATVIIKGQGVYSGTVKQNFNIVPQSPELSVVVSNDVYNLSWNALPGATGYEIYGSIGGSEYSLLKTIDATETDAQLSIEIASDGKEYKFKIRAYKELYPQIFYSKWN